MHLSEETFEFGQACLRTKSSLRFSMRESGTDIWYIVEDEATGSFFRIGLPQYTFLSLLDGRRTVNSALMRTASLLRQHALDENEIANICKWAIESGLVETELLNSASRRATQENRQAMTKAMAWLNPITFKIPLFQPDGFVTRLERYCGWLVSPGGAILWMLVGGFGFFQLLNHWQRFVGNRINSFSVNDFLWIGVAWIVLKLVHELAHSIVCKKYGGKVQSSGILLLLLIPLPYVDVSSSWRFESKFRRILTAAAGILSELFIAAIACCIWVWSDPGPLQYHAGNVILTATVSTILFNINPLMRFDGYYILSDLLDIPNLSTHGKQYVKSFFKRIYFGNKYKPLEEIGWRSLVVKLYGFLAIVWFAFVAVGLSLGASNIIEGFGLLVVLISIAMWFAIPMVMGIKHAIVGSKFEQPNRLRLVTALGITGLLVFAFCKYCPSPSVISAPIVIDFDPHKVVRNETSGFARLIHVKNGDRVQQGDLLVTLDNPELQAEYKSLLIDIGISKLRVNSLLATEEIALLKLEQEALHASLTRKDELELLLSKLEVRAIQSGVVLSLDLDSKLDTYFKTGDEILSIGEPEQLHAIALARQEDIKWINEQNMENVDLYIWGRSENEWLRGTIAKVEPRARDDLPHEAFAASNGGPLAVVPRNSVEEGETASDDSDELMLTNPRVPIEIELAETIDLLPGQSGEMIIRGRDLNMGNYLMRQFTRFVSANNARNHGL